MTTGDTDRGDERPRTRLEGSGRKPREDGTRVSNVTAGTEHSEPKATSLLMELIVSRENMTLAYARVVGNKGAAGIDKMSFADLKPFLVEHWPRVREDLLADRSQQGLRQGGLAAAGEADELGAEAFRSLHGGQDPARHALLGAQETPPATRPAR